MAWRLADARPVNWIVGNKLLWNLTNWHITIQEHAFEIAIWKMLAILSRLNCANINWTMSRKEVPCIVIRLHLIKLINAQPPCLYSLYSYLRRIYKIKAFSTRIDLIKTSLHRNFLWNFSLCIRKWSNVMDYQSSFPPYYTKHPKLGRPVCLILFVNDSAFLISRGTISEKNSERCSIVQYRVTFERDVP